MARGWVMSRELETFGRDHFGKARLGDVRRTRRLVRIADQMGRHPGGTLPEKMQDPHQLKALYRLADRPEVSHPAVLQPHTDRTRALMAAHKDVVLLVHDTTELDLTSQRCLRDQLGHIGNGYGSRGYHCHNSLAITAAGEPLGLASQILHKRRRRNKSESRKARRERPDRESRLWKRARQAIGPTPEGCTWVDICDRGADGFEFLDHEHQSGARYVVRSQSNRVCFLGHEPGGQKAKLHSHLRTLPPVASREVAVPAAPASRGKPARAARTATVGVAWAAVTLPAPLPGQARGEHRQEPLQVWALRVWELAPPEGVEELEWLLLSNVAVNVLADAWERVDWYELRWATAEEYHKGQKTGCGIEKMQFTDLSRMEPLIAVVSVVAWLLMRLRWLGRDEASAQRPARDYVPESWVLWLSRWRTGSEQPDWTVREFFLALGRLGGHQNRPSDGPPGWQTLWKGWMKLRVAVGGEPEPDRSG